MTIQVNVSLDENDAASLDHMAQEDGFDNRSAFVRRLIRQEASRRQSLPTQPQPCADSDAPDGTTVPVYVDGVL